MSAVDTMAPVVALSLSLSGSLSEVTDATLVYVVPALAPFGTCPTNVNVALLPAARPAIVQVVVAAGVPQLKAGPLFCVNETNVCGDDGGDPAGNVSDHATLVATSGPKLLTV